MIIHKSNIENIPCFGITHFKDINAVMHPVGDSKATHDQYGFHLVFQQIHFRCFLHIQNQQKIPLCGTGLVKRNKHIPFTNKRQQHFIAFDYRIELLYTLRYFLERFRFLQTLPCFTSTKLFPIFNRGR